MYGRSSIGQRLEQYIGESEKEHIIEMHMNK